MSRGDRVSNDQHDDYDDGDNHDDKPIGSKISGDEGMNLRMI